MRAFRCAISRPRLAPAGCCLAEANAGTGDRDSGTVAGGVVLTGLAAAAAEGEEDGRGTLERVTRAEGGAAEGGRPGVAGAGADGWVRLRNRAGDIGRMTSSSSVAMLVGRHSGSDVVLSALLFMGGEVDETGAQLLA